MHRVSNMMRWPHYPFQLIVAFGSAMYAIVLLIQTRPAAAQASAREQHDVAQ